MNKPVAPPKTHCNCPTCFGILTGRIGVISGMGKIRRK